jgi:hypothetical protein
MKHPDELGKENERTTSSKGDVERPWDGKAGQKSSLKEADGIIHGDAKKAGEAVIKNDEKASSYPLL